MSDVHVETTLEEEVLGALLRLRTPQVIRDLIHEIDPEAFYQPRHEQALNAIARALTSDPHEPLVLNDVYRELKKTDRVGEEALTWLMGLAHQATPVPARVKKQIRELNDLAANRDLAAHLRKLTQSTAQPGRTYEQNLAEAQAAFITGRQPSASRDQSVYQATEELFAQMDRAKKRGGMPEMTSGSALLDEAIGGCPPGEYYIFGGGPGSGKSVMVTDMLRAWLNHGHAALVISLEMTQVHLLQRIVSAETEIPVRKIQSGTVSDEELDKMSTAVAKIHQSAGRLTVIDRSIGIDEIELEIARHKADWDRAGVTGGVLLDYFQRIPGANASDRYSFYSGASTRLANAAKRHHVFVGAMAQFGRLGGHAPTIESFKETGQLELDATVAVLLHRPDQFDPTHDRKGMADFIIAKNRYLGNTDTIERVADLRNSRFLDPRVSATDPRNRPAPGAGGWGSPA